MIIDLGQEQEQKERAYGPVPGGSRVLVRLTVEPPRYPSSEDRLVAQAKSGLLYLYCRLEVIGGTYDGVYWHENIMLPCGVQYIGLTEGQRKVCGSGGRTLRAIVEAVNRIEPKDVSPQAAEKRRLSSWSELDGVEFPARLGIDRQPYEGNDGRLYWSNTLGRVLTCSDREYQEILNGGEFITDGPVAGNAQQARQQQGQERQRQPYGQPARQPGGGAGGAPGEDWDRMPF